MFDTLWLQTCHAPHHKVVSIKIKLINNLLKILSRNKEKYFTKQSNALDFGYLILFFLINLAKDLRKYNFFCIYYI